MTIVGSGQLSLGPSAGTDRSISGEFGGSAPFSLQDYYAGAGLVPSGTPGVPSSGSISFTDFYGTSNLIDEDITVGSVLIGGSIRFKGYNDSTSYVPQGTFGSITGDLVFGNVLHSFYFGGNGNIGTGLNIVIQGNFGNNPATNNPFSSVTFQVTSGATPTMTFLATTASGKTQGIGSPQSTRWEFVTPASPVIFWPDAAVRNVIFNP